MSSHGSENPTSRIVEWCEDVKIEYRLSDQQLVAHMAEALAYLSDRLKA